MRTAHDETFYSFALSAFLMRCHPFLRIAQKYNNESNKKTETIKTTHIENLILKWRKSWRRHENNKKMGFWIECKFYNRTKETLPDMVTFPINPWNKYYKFVDIMQQKRFNFILLLHVQWVMWVLYCTALCVTWLLDLWDANLKTQSVRGRWRERMNARSNESQCFHWTNTFQRLKSLHAPCSMIERWTYKVLFCTYNFW